MELMATLLLIAMVALVGGFIEESTRAKTH